MLTLKNKLHLTNAVDLAREEERISKKKAVELFESGYLDTLKPGSLEALQKIHAYLFSEIYDFAGQIRTVNLAKGNFRFAPVMYLEAALKNVEAMPQSTFDEIVEKYVEMNIAHPFREGKGELSRILSTLLLLQNHYTWAREVSIDSLIEQQRSTYYQTLKRGQQNRYSSQENITAWVLFLCNIWLQALRSLVTNLPETKVAPPVSPSGELHTPSSATPAENPATPPVYLNSRQKRVLAVLEREEPAKVSDLAHRLQGVSINTLKKDLLYLRQHNLITAHGVLKGTIYTLKK